ncbi:MAG TPA: fimbria/pilus outer membrane usher protein [Candidatus Elarobacter sp.]|nr:fimbria/pilus outer membrane usher protein [Candidatus Elarobacter sp.]
MRRVLPAILAGALAASGALPARADPDRLLADLAWNGEAQPRSLILIDGAEVFVARSLLQAHGVEPRAGACDAKVVDECYVALSPLHDVLTFRFDPAELRLDVRVSAALLPSRALRIAREAPSYEQQFLPALAMSYGLRETPGTPWSAWIDQRYSPRPNALFESTAGRTASGAFARGLSSFTLDAPGASRRLVVGDTTLSGGPLATSGVIGGIAVEREFALNPYALTFPMPSIETTVAAPSRADVYVNGVLVKSMTLAPGNYHLSDVPIVAGYSNARVVLHNELGQQISEDAQYGAPSLLRAGLTDYQYAVGFLRDDAGGAPRYDRPLASARYRLGASSRATLGAAAQLAPGASAFALEYDGVLGFGIVHADAAESSADGVSGSAFSAAYATTGRSGALGANVHWQDPRFRTVTSLAGEERILADAAITKMQRIGAATTLSLTARETRYATAGAIASAVVTASRRFGAWDLGLSYTRERAFSALRRAGNELSIALTRARGASSQSVRYDSASGGAVVSVAHGSGTAIGTSYALDAGLAGNAPQTARAQIGLPFASVNLDAAAAAGAAPRLAAEVDGSVVYAAHRVLFGQRLGDAFAVVSADGMGAADVTLDGQRAGRTDRHGYLLLPALGSNAANAVGLSGADLPLDQMVDAAGERRAGPPYHAGTLVHFGAHRVHAVYGTVRVRDASGRARIPAYGELELRTAGTDATASSPIDETGEFYVDRVAPGRYDARIVDGSGECRFRIEIPAFSEPARDLGALQCDGA